MRARPFHALVLVALLAIGLGAKRKDYVQLYEAHTRQLLIYQGFATALNLRATLLTPRFRRAIAQERSRLLGPIDADEQAFLDRLMSDGEAYHEVVFSADSGLDEGGRFGTTDDGWILELLADGQPQPIVTVYKVRKPNPMQRSLYPHFNVWSELWIARFERNVPDPRVVELRVGSGYGHGELRWEDVE